MDDKRVHSEKLIPVSKKKNFIWFIGLIKEAERIRQSSSRNPKDKIDIYHETAEACRSVGNVPPF